MAYFETWSTRTQKLVMLRDDRDMASAIANARNTVKLFANIDATPEDLMVCAAPSDGALGLLKPYQRKALDRFGEWINPQACR